MTTTDNLNPVDLAAIDQEQALLGALLCDNTCYPRIRGQVSADDFTDPFYREVYAVAETMIHRGERANPITLQEHFPGKKQYFGKLAANSAHIVDVKPYAKAMKRRSHFRLLKDVGRSIVDASAGPTDACPIELAVKAQRALDSYMREASSDLSPISAGKFLAMKMPVREAIIPGFLHAQSTAMVSGWRGLGKSWFMLGLGIAIASGTKFLKWEAGAPRGVLYVDGEMPAVAMQERLLKLTEGAAPTELFRLLCADMQENGIPDLSSPAGQAAIERAIGDSEVLILDNISTLFRTGVENEAESWLPVQQWLLRLRRRGRTVILVHHTGKGGEQRGTSKREDVLDLSLLLKSPSDHTPSDGARFELHFRKGRGLVGPALDTFEVALGAGPRGELLWTWKTIEDARAPAVLELHQEGLSVRQIEAETGISKSSVQRILAKCPSVSRSSAGTVGQPHPKPGRAVGQRAGQHNGNAYRSAKNGVTEWDNDRDSGGTGAVPTRGTRRGEVGR